MSDKKLFTKTKAAELKAEIEQTFKKSKPLNRIRIVLRKVIANVILNNNELGALMPDIIPLLQTDDLEIRKMCLSYISSCGAFAKPAEVGEALPFLNQFANGLSPAMRALAIKTKSSVPTKAFIDSSFESIKFHLKDPDPNVRKVSAYAVSRLFQYDHTRAEAEGLIDSLNDLLYDSSTVVVSNALAALNYITELNNNLSLNIDSQHATTLVSLLNSTDEWCQIYILNSLMLYVSQSSNESLALIEGILPCLQHENSSVVLNSIKAIVYFCNYVNKPELVIPSLLKRLGSSLASLLSKPPEIQFLVLRNVILLLLDKKDLISINVEMFFCRYDDPIYVKDTKLEIIYLLANESNYSVVLRELEEYATEVDVSMARKAMRAFGNLAVKLPDAAEECVNIVVDLVSNGISYILQEATVVIKNILRKYPGRFNFVIPELMKHYKLIDEPDAKSSAIWIVGQFCEEISNPLSILEHFAMNFMEEAIEVQYASLTAVTKFYLKYPQFGELLLLRVLKWATEEVNNPDIRDRGYIYWRMLSTATPSNTGVFQEQTKSIVLNSNPLISTENDKIDGMVLEELELNIGTLASIYLKPVQNVFRLARRKTLPYSPALQAKQAVNNDSPIEPKQTPESSHKVFQSRPKTVALSESFSTERSNSSIGRNGPLARPLSYDSVSTNENVPSPKKDSFTRRLTKKASTIASRKGSNLF